MSTAVLATIGLVITIVGYVTGYDVWAHFTGNESISGVIHDALHGEITGPLVFGGFGGLYLGLLYHFLTTTGH